MGSQRHYESDLKKIFDEFDKKKNAGPMKMKHGYVEPPSPYPVLAKYPMQILIDKAGYTPKEVINYKGKKNFQSKIMVSLLHQKLKAAN